MARKFFLALSVITFLIIGLSSGVWSLEKIRFAISVKEVIYYYLPDMAAAERGLWKENGLEASSTALKTGGDFTRALAAGAIDLGLGTAGTTIQGIVRGVPALIVSDLYHKEDVFLWVRTDSPLKSARELKGVKIGVNRFGGRDHAYGRVVAKALGLEKEVKIVSVGGISEAVAALKSGAVDVTVRSGITMAKLKEQGEVRELLNISTDYLPKDWVDSVMTAHKDYARKNPETLRKGVRALLQSLDYIRNNPGWALEKIKAESGYSEKVARDVYGSLRFTVDGQLSKGSLENVRNFLTEYEIVPKEKMPRVEELYSPEFTR